jgi:hypothetical protein
MSRDSNEDKLDVPRYTADIKIKMEITIIGIKMDFFI